MGRFTHLSVKLFQAGWNGELQESGWLTPLDQEAMSDILGQKNESSSSSLPTAFSTDEGKFPFEDIESLVFGMMHMQGRRKTWRQGLFDQAEGLSSVLPDRFEQHECAKKPDSRAFITGEKVRVIACCHGMVLLSEASG
nr:hypothetical protein [Thermogemmatispora tikiterensis]